MSQMDTQISLCHKRSKRPTFFTMKTGVEIQSKRSDQFGVPLVFHTLLVMSTLFSFEALTTQLV